MLSFLPPTQPPSLSPYFTHSTSLPLYLFLCHSLPPFLSAYFSVTHFLPSSLPFSLSLTLTPSLLPSLSLPSSLPPQVSKDESASKIDPATASTAAVTYKVRENQHYVASSMRRPKTWREELKPREPLYVGVITATKFLHTRARGVNNTWGKLMPKLEFFSAPSKAKHGLAVVNLPDVDDSYPPQKKVY